MKTITFEVVHEKLGNPKFPVEELFEEVGVVATIIPEKCTRTIVVYKIVAPINDGINPLTLAYLIGQLVHSIKMRELT